MIGGIRVVKKARKPIEQFMDGMWRDRHTTISSKWMDSLKVFSIRQGEREPKKVKINSDHTDHYT